MENEMGHSKMRTFNEYKKKVGERLLVNTELVITYTPFDGFIDGLLDCSHVEGGIEPGNDTGNIELV